MSAGMQNARGVATPAGVGVGAAGPYDRAEGWLARPRKPVNRPGRAGEGLDRPGVYPGSMRATGRPGPAGPGDTPRLAPVYGGQP